MRTTGAELLLSKLVRRERNGKEWKGVWLRREGLAEGGEGKGGEKRNEREEVAMVLADPRQTKAFYL